MATMYYRIPLSLVFLIILKCARMYLFSKMRVMKKYLTGYPAHIIPSVTFNESSHSLHISRFNTGTVTSLIAVSYAVFCAFGFAVKNERREKIFYSFILECIESGLSQWQCEYVVVVVLLCML